MPVSMHVQFEKDLNDMHVNNIAAKMKAAIFNVKSAYQVNDITKHQEA